MIPLVPTSETMTIKVNGVPILHKAFVLAPEISKVLGCGCSTHDWIYPATATPIAECSPEPLMDGKFVADRVTA
jgi:hypothetical protein